MVILKIYVNRLAVNETESDSPVAAYRNAPDAAAIAGQPMQPVAGKVDIPGPFSGGKDGQKAGNTLYLVRVKTAGVTRLPKPAQT